MSSSKRTSVPPKEWAKHLRPFGKNQFWSSVRNLFRSEEKEEMIQEIDPEELKRNKEEYETELRASLNGEPDNRLPYIVATRIDDGVNEEIGIPVKDRHGNVLYYTNMTMPCPEPNQINPADDKCVSTIKSLIDLHGKTMENFKSIREEMGEPGPMSTDDPLFIHRRIPPPDVYVPVVDQIKANAESVDVFFPDKEDKPLPKVVTIEVAGLEDYVNSILLQLIDDVIEEKIGITPLCAVLEDETRQLDINPDNVIFKQLIKRFKSGEIVIEMRERTIKPKAFSHDCPCCD